MNQIKRMKKNILLILPFGNFRPEEEREKQLKVILDKLEELINKVDDGVKYFILVVEQIKPLKYFNRGQILNIGVKYFKDNVGTPTRIIFHDIDMIPNFVLFKQYSNTKHLLLNLVPANSPTHKQKYNFTLAAGGGIFSTEPRAFIKVNGYPNNFWGWGGEDNALDYRYRINNYISSYVYVGNYESMDKQREKGNAQKMEYLSKNKIRNMTVWENLRINKKYWRQNGYKQLEKLNYSIINSKIKEVNDKYTYLYIAVELDKIGLNDIN